MLDKLRNLNIERSDLDDMVYLLTQANAMALTYAATSTAAPDWLQDTIETLTKEVKSRQRDALAAKLKSAKARRDSLKTAEEKRSALDAEIAELEQKLG